MAFRLTIARQGTNGVNAPSVSKTHDRVETECELGSARIAPIQLSAKRSDSLAWWQLGYSLRPYGDEGAMVEACVSDYSQTVAMCPGDHWHATGDGGRDVTFEQARSQIGKGGDKLIPVFLTEAKQRDHGQILDEWRGKRFKSAYLPLVRPFSAVTDLLRRVRKAGLRVAVASSAKKDELEKYLAIAGIVDLVDVATSSEDVDESKPAPDIFDVMPGEAWH